MRERVGASPWARRGALLGPRRRPRGNADRSARTTALSRATQFPTRARRALGVSFGIRSATSARSPRALIAGCDRALPFKNQTGFSSSVVGRVWLARARARAKKIS